MRKDKEKKETPRNREEKEKGRSCLEKMWMKQQKKYQHIKKEKKKIEIHETRNVDQCYQSAKKRKR